MMACEIILGQKETFLRRKRAFSSEEKLLPFGRKGVNIRCRWPSRPYVLARAGVCEGRHDRMWQKQHPVLSCFNILQPFCRLLFLVSFEVAFGCILVDLMI